MSKQFKRNSSGNAAVSDEWRNNIEKRKKQERLEKKRKKEAERDRLQMDLFER